MNIANFISRYGAYYSAKPAVIFRDKTITYAEMTSRVNRLANSLLDMGIKAGDKVALLADNCPQFLELFFARYEIGVVEVNLNTRLEPNEIARQVNEVEAVALFFAPEYAEIVTAIKPKLISVKHFVQMASKLSGFMNYEELISLGRDQPVEIDVNISEQSLCRIVYTGGTTGTPKGVMLSRGADMAQLRNMLVDLVRDLNSDDTFLGLQPLYHAARPFIFPCWMRGATHVIVPDFKVETALNAIGKHKVTVIKTVPTVLIRLISSQEIKESDLSSIRTVIYGGSPISTTQLKDAIKIFGPILVQNYGQTEAAMTVCYLDKKDHFFEDDPKKVARLASIGRPYSWVEVRISDEYGNHLGPNQEGELLVRGDHIMSGYLKRPEATAESLVNGWIHTRDIGRMDDDGYIYLVDRKGDMIKTGGEGVYPNEVEQVLCQHPAVMESCVFGIPDAQWGETVAAAVAFKPGKVATETELIDFCKASIARYKAPRKIIIRESLPKSAMGKILRKELRAPFWEGHERVIN